MADDYDNNDFDFKNGIGNDLALANGAVLTVSGRIFSISRAGLTAYARPDGEIAVSEAGAASAVIPACDRIENGPADGNGMPSAVSFDAAGRIPVGTGFNTGSAVDVTGVPDAAGRRDDPDFNAGKTTVFVESAPSSENAGGIGVCDTQIAMAGGELSEVTSFPSNVFTGILPLTGNADASAGYAQGRIGANAAAPSLSSRSSGRNITMNADDAAKFTSFRLGGDTAVSCEVTMTGKQASGYSVSVNSGIYTAVEDRYVSGHSIGIATGRQYAYCGGSPWFDESIGGYIVRPYPWYGWIEIEPRPFIGYPELVWEEYSVELDNEWVRLDDADYSKIDLEYAAKLSFTVNTKSAAMFTIYRCVEGEDGSCTLTEIQLTSLAFDRDADEYAAKTKALLLEAGQYYISIRSEGAAEDGSDYKVFLNDDETEFFTDGDNSDDWTDMRSKGLDGEISSAGELNEDSFCLACDWVGFGDEIDYMGFTLGGAAKLSFSIDATDATKFTLYRIVQDKKGSYSLKALQTVSLSFDSDSEDYEAKTKALLLEAGEYCFSVQSSNAARGGSAYYDVYVDDENSEFFTDGDNSDDWTDFRTGGDFGQVGNVGILNESRFDVLNGWVGFGDAVDYAGFTLTSAAKLSFCIDATDAASFTVYRLVQGKNGPYSLKALQTTSLSFDRDFEDYEAKTKALLLEAGDYYISVQSSNAARGGSAYYNVYLNSEDTEFFTTGDNGDDWTDLKTEGDFGQVGYVGVVNEYSSFLLSDWVGFGDAVDYAGFTLSSAAKLSFSIDATDAAKFTLYRLVQGKNGSYSLAALQTITLSFDKTFEDYEAVTKALLLEAGDYYFSVESANASRGGSAYYNVCLNSADSEFYTDDGDDWTEPETEDPCEMAVDTGFLDAACGGIVSGPVGLNGADYARFELAGTAKLSFVVDATDAATFTLYRAIRAKNGKCVLTELQTTALVFDGTMEDYEAKTQALLLEAGEYYIAVESPNAGQDDGVYYNVGLNSEASDFFTSGDNWDDWNDVRLEGPNGRVGYVGVLDQTSSELLSDWVGCGDAVDCAGFTLAGAAKLSFSIDAADAVKFTVYRLVQAKSGKYSLTALQTVELAFNENMANYEAVTQALLLEAGDYYFSVESMNAAQGGSSSYRVCLNGENSEFFPQDETWNDWTDLETMGEYGEVGELGFLDPYSADAELLSGWVGFGDESDYAGFTVDCEAKLSFSLSATDAAAFTLYSLVQAKSGKYSLTALQTTALELNSATGMYEAVTDLLPLDAGRYYLSVRSANVAQGAYYSLYLNGADSEFIMEDMVETEFLPADENEWSAPGTSDLPELVLPEYSTQRVESVCICQYPPVDEVCPCAVDAVVAAGTTCEGSAFGLVGLDQESDVKQSGWLETASLV